MALAGQVFVAPKGTATALNAEFWNERFRDGAWRHLGSIAESPRYGVVAAYVHKLGGGRVLDAGCGEGFLADYLDLGRVEYTGCDISTAAIARARDRHPGLRWSSCSLESLVQTTDERYDVLVLNEVLASLERPIETLRRCAGLAEPGGHLVISQYQGAGGTSFAATFAAELEAEIAGGRFALLGTVELAEPQAHLRWRISCVRAHDEGPGA
jgi:2-polyprenyl-3-methyl-5-hydroxy-6-metoxy-1,4-benzoquinol methylase